MLCAVFLLALLLTGAAQADEEIAPIGETIEIGETGRPYEVRFSADFKPGAGHVRAAIRVRQEQRRLRLLDFSAPASRYADFSGDGAITRHGDRLLWTVPAGGGTLRYRVKVDHKRGSDYDAVLKDAWSIGRLDDLFPAARVRTLTDSHSVSSLKLTGPSSWRFETRYGPVTGTVPFDQPDRRFARPTGWFSAGKLGVRRDTIEDRKVTVAAPLNQGMRRVDILAFLRWTLPDLLGIFPDFPDRLLITGAGDDMWRGALSGPSSLYLHSDRPLISENGTSTLLHELVHVAVGLPRGPSEDWILEGLAEYYSLEVLRRSGTISQQRYDQALRRLTAWAKKDDGQLTSPSTGANTARAVMTFVAIRKELAGEGVPDLDTVVRKLVKSGRMERDGLAAILEQALGRPSAQLGKAMETYAQPLP